MRAKTRKQIITQYYVNRKDIQTLLGIPRAKASELFEIVDEEESRKQFRAHENKVPLLNVLDRAGVRYAFLEQQVKKEEP